MTGARASDAALMKRVARGDRQACRLLVDQHLPGALALGQRMLGDRALAEDIAQESFARLWKQAPRWRPDAEIRTYLYRVAHNLAIDMLRKKGRESLSDSPPEQADTTGPADGRQATEVAMLVQQAVARLPERQRTALALVHFDEISGKDAASIMGVSVEALESLLARARRQLRADLETLHPDLTGDAA